MDEFSALLSQWRRPVERYVHFRIASQADAEDVLQEIFLTAYRRFDALRDRQAFLAWILAIARSKCLDYFRAKARQMEIPLEIREEMAPTGMRHGRAPVSVVRETLSSMADREKQILWLYYFQNLPQADIAKRLNIPVGTVKSRLYAAKASFRLAYPYPPRTVKGEICMTKLYEKLPSYTITPSEKEPFEVRCEEMIDWMIVPRAGEKLKWGLYEQPGGVRTEWCEMEVVGKAEVHGIEGVEIRAVQYNTENYYRTGAIDRAERTFIVQLTDTHCRTLAESHVENGVRKCYTFLDGDPFLNNWGYGEDNCGREVEIRQKGTLKCEGRTVTSANAGETMDVVGRYTVSIGGKEYDTISVLDACTFNDCIASETYLDKEGRTVLWRRFNRDDWAMKHFGPQKWSERLPENERLIINGQVYVHWYDCVTDRI